MSACYGFSLVARPRGVCPHTPGAHHQHTTTRTHTFPSPDAHDAKTMAEFGQPIEDVEKLLARGPEPSSEVWCSFRPFASDTRMIFGGFQCFTTRLFIIDSMMEASDTRVRTDGRTKHTRTQSEKRTFSKNTYTDTHKCTAVIGTRGWRTHSRSHTHAHTLSTAGHTRRTRHTRRDTLSEWRLPHSPRTEWCLRWPPTSIEPLVSGLVVVVGSAPLRLLSGAAAFRSRSLLSLSLFVNGAVLVMAVSFYMAL